MNPSNPKLKAEVTITRSSSDVIRIVIRDETSFTTFVELEMKPEEFAMAVTGLSYRPAEMKVRGLEHVGKTRINEKRQIVCPLKTYDKEILVAWLEDHAQEDGWILNTYLGSQNSISRNKDGETVLNYSVTKYV
jgi:hypothetical protein